MTSKNSTKAHDYLNSLAIQLARLSGFSSIIATSSLHNAPLLESLGATTIVDRKEADVQTEITKSAKGALIDVVFDAISDQDTQAVGWDVLAPGGTLILVTRRPTVDREKYSDKKVVDDVFGVLHAPHLRALGVSLCAALPRLIETSAIKVSRWISLHGLSLTFATRTAEPC